MDAGSCVCVCVCVEGPGSEDSSVDGWEDEGSAVRKEGSKSRVLSSVRGTFSARRFYEDEGRLMLVIKSSTWRQRYKGVESRDELSSQKDPWPPPSRAQVVSATSPGLSPFYFYARALRA